MFKDSLVHVVETAADGVEIRDGHVGDVGHVPGDEGVAVKSVVVVVEEVQLACTSQLIPESGDAGVRH
jgi:hypothetical protein